MILIHIFKYAPCVKSYTVHILPGEVGGHSLFPWCRHWQVVNAKNDRRKKILTMVVVRTTMLTVVVRTKMLMLVVRTTILTTIAGMRQLGVEVGEVLRQQLILCRNFSIFMKTFSLPINLHMLRYVALHTLLFRHKSTSQKVKFPCYGHSIHFPSLLLLQIFLGFLSISYIYIFYLYIIITILL